LCKRRLEKSRGGLLNEWGTPQTKKRLGRKTGVNGLVGRVQKCDQRKNKEGKEAD